MQQIIFRKPNLYMSVGGYNKCQNSIIKLEGIKNVNIFFAFASSTDTVEIIIIYCCIL